MPCQACGAQLPSEAKACPQCGHLTPAYYANADASASTPTLPAASGSFPAALSVPPPPTQYGSDPYEKLLQSSYAVNPYEAPPPPPSQRPRNRIGLIAGVVLILLGSSVFALLAYASARNAEVSSVPAHARTIAGTALQHFIEKGTFTIVSKTVTFVRQEGQNKVYRILEQEVDYGDVTGLYTSELTSIVQPDTTASFSGRSTCTCTVAGKSGTLLWSLIGTATADGSIQGQDTDVHGTGDLAKLHGQGTFQQQGLHGTYSSELYFVV